MAGFMAGFGSAFADSFRQSQAIQAQEIQDMFHAKFKAYQDNRESYTKAKAEDARTVRLAKSLTEGTATPNAWPKVREWLADGMTVAQVEERIKNGSFDIRASQGDISNADTTDDPSVSQDISQAAAGAVDSQMKASGMETPQGKGIFGPAAMGAGAPTGYQAEGTMDTFGGGYASRRADKKLAEATGDSEASKMISYEPESLPGSSDRVIMYRPNPKETGNYKLTDIDSLASVTTFLADAELRGDKKEIARLSHIKKALSELESAKGDKNAPKTLEDIAIRRATAEAEGDYAEVALWTKIYDDVAEMQLKQAAGKADIDTKKAKEVAKFGDELDDQNRETQWERDDRLRREAEARDNALRIQERRERAEEADTAFERSLTLQGRGFTQADKVADRERGEKLRDADTSYMRSVDTPEEALTAESEADLRGDQKMKQFYRNRYNSLVAEETRSGEVKANQEARAKGIVPAASGYSKSLGQVVRRGPDGLWIDAQGKPLNEMDVTPYNEEMWKQITDIKKSGGDTAQKFTEDTSRLGESIALADEMNKIVQQTPDVITYAGNIANFVSQAQRDIQGTIDLIGGGGTITPAQIQKIAKAEKSLMNEIANSDLMQRADHLAIQKSLFDAKATRMAYALAASQDQTGKAVAVQEFQKFYDQITNRGGGPEGFQQGMAEFLSSQYQKLKNQERVYNEYNGRLQDFEMQHGVPAPVTIVQPIDVILGDNLPKMQKFSEQAASKQQTRVGDNVPMPEGYPDGEGAWAQLSPRGKQLYLKKYGKAQ